MRNCKFIVNFAENSKPPCNFSERPVAITNIDIKMPTKNPYGNMMIADLPEPETVHAEELLELIDNKSIDLICVLGPTASGKTRYAVELARELNRLRAAREENIGPDRDGEIPYHLIDIVDAGTKFDLYQYQRAFERAYKDIRSRGGIPILCGGSGLYLEAATCGYSIPDVPPSPELRAELEEKTTDELVSMLASMKPLHNKTDIDTRQRLIRALEIAIYQKNHPVENTSYLPKNTYYIGTLVSREERNRRIDARLDARITEGMVDEVRRLLESGIPAENLTYYGLEYKFVTQHVLGVLTLDEMKTLLGNAIHQFAKRQMTWFRGMERKGIRIHWVEP